MGSQFSNFLDNHIFHIMNIKLMSKDQYYPLFGVIAQKKPQFLFVPKLFPYNCKIHAEDATIFKSK